MAPINFEDKIKEKLEGRSIEPKTSSWNALADRLDAKQPKRNNKGYWWIGIAASFIGVLIITNVMFDKNDTKTVSPTIVDTENNIHDKEQIIPALKEQIKNEEENVLVISEIEDTELDEVKEKGDIKDLKQPVKVQNQREIQLKQKEIIKEEVRKDNALAQTEVNLEKDISNVKSEFKELSLEDQKLNAVVAELKKLDEANPYSVDNEVDSLLRAAQQEIRFQRLYKQAIQTVNADELLKEVEVDLDNSFRDRVFKAIISGYNGVKTTVTNRNN